ncbi:MAG: DUF4760 domain-containing protein [Elusimicrobiota bacterium]
MCEFKYQNIFAPTMNIWIPFISAIIGAVAGSVATYCFNKKSQKVNLFVEKVKEYNKFYENHTLTVEITEKQWYYESINSIPTHDYVTAEHKQMFYDECNYWESLGILYKNGYLNGKLVKDYFSEIIVRRYDVLKKIVEIERKRATNNKIYENFEYLYNKIKRGEKKDGRQK